MSRTIWHKPTQAHHIDNFYLNFNPKRYHAAEPASSHYEPAFATTISPSPFPNDSNSAKCLTHALSYSPKSINNPSFFLVTNITAPPSSHTLFQSNHCTLSPTCTCSGRIPSYHRMYTSHSPLHLDDLSSVLGTKSCLSSLLPSPLPPSSVHLK
jgi:hypothetical protein